MKLEFKRKEVIKLIQNYYLLNMDISERGNILIANNIENIGDEDVGWNEAEINKYKYNRFVYEQYNFGVLITNAYLVQLIYDFYKVRIEIIDNNILDTGTKCVCCNYKTAYKYELHSICPVCLWQYDFSGETTYSKPNRATLKEYRDSFLSKKRKNLDDIIYKMFHHCDT